MSKFYFINLQRGYKPFVQRALFSSSPIFLNDDENNTNADTSQTHNEIEVLKDEQNVVMEQMHDRACKRSTAYNYALSVISEYTRKSNRISLNISAAPIMEATDRELYTKLDRLKEAEILHDNIDDIKEDYARIGISSSKLDAYIGRIDILQSLYAIHRIREDDRNSLDSFKANIDQALIEYNRFTKNEIETLDAYFELEEKIKELEESNNNSSDNLENPLLNTEDNSNETEVSRDNSNETEVFTGEANETEVSTGEANETEVSRGEANETKVSLDEAPNVDTDETVNQSHKRKRDVSDDVSDEERVSKSNKETAPVEEKDSSID